MSGLIAVYQIIELLTSAFVMLIIIQFVIGLLFSFNVVSPSNQFLMAFYDGINRFLQPILQPVRRIMPDTGAIDLSPLVVILGAQVVLILLRSVILG